ncbi:MAG TPA: hypothetical protein VLX28_11110 [Thermoanaerobaculia bacterium]|nr:hypothetical protein [Thermoanaerobaculia bacterium]
MKPALLALLLLLPLAARAQAPAAAAQPAIRFEEIGAAVGARLQHHTHKFKGKYADVLGRQGVLHSRPA